LQRGTRKTGSSVIITRGDLRECGMDKKKERNPGDKSPVYIRKKTVDKNENFALSALAFIKSRHKHA
jgi:hypothetical protein